MGYKRNGIIICRHSAMVASSRLNRIFGIKTQFVTWNCCFIRFHLTPLWLAEWTRGNIENYTDLCVCMRVCVSRWRRKRPCLFWLSQWNPIWNYVCIRAANRLEAVSQADLKITLIELWNNVWRNCNFLHFTLHQTTETEVSRANWDWDNCHVANAHLYFFWCPWSPLENTDCTDMTSTIRNNVSNQG